MKIEILDKKEDQLFNREFLKVTGPNEGSTPSRISIKNELVKKLKVKHELVQVHKISTNFGGGFFSADIVVYKDEKRLSILESEKYKKINKITEEKKKEPAEKASNDESSSDGEQ